MASTNAEAQERHRLYKFTKVLALKVAQIVVQSRQGKKISHDSISKADSEAALSLQWFNLSIPDVPYVNEETKLVLNGEVVDALSKVLCIEISLRTNDGDAMILEIWTVRLSPGCMPCSPSTVYYRMSVMLKSTLTISRITPAYKLSRAQHKETYKIYHRIYGGEPNYNILGEKYKQIKVHELRSPIGTLLIEVAYRTKMTILPEDKPKITYDKQNSNNDLMLKSDHFLKDSPRIQRRTSYEKKALDLSKPLTAGAFVDAMEIKELHESLSQQLPPEPTTAWLFSEKDSIENQLKTLSSSGQGNNDQAGSSKEPPIVSEHAVSKAIEVPKKNDKYKGLMEFAFADGSPITELASFFQDCLQARSMSEEWSSLLDLSSTSTDSESLSRQLKMFEDAVPEFDNMVASMFTDAETGYENI